MILKHKDTVSYCDHNADPNLASVQDHGSEYGQHRALRPFLVLIFLGSFGEQASI